MQINDTLNAQPLYLKPMTDLNSIMSHNQNQFNLVNSSQGHLDTHFQQTNLLVGLIDRMLNFIFSIVDRLIMNPIQPTATAQESSNTTGGLGAIVGDLFSTLGSGLLDKLTGGISKVGTGLLGKITSGISKLF